MHIRSLYTLYLSVETFGKELQVIISICNVVIQRLLVLSVGHECICWGMGLSGDETMQGKHTERSTRSLP